MPAATVIARREKRIGIRLNFMCFWLPDWLTFLSVHETGFAKSLRKEPESGSTGGFPGAGLAAPFRWLAQPIWRTLACAITPSRTTRRPGTS